MSRERPGMGETWRRVAEGSSICPLGTPVGVDDLPKPAEEQRG